MLRSRRIVSALRRQHSTLATDLHRLQSHPVYATLRDPRHFKTFLTNHCFAALGSKWLVKTLQHRLLCADPVWKPPTNNLVEETMRSILLYEEIPISSFDLYQNVMRSALVTTGIIDEFTKKLQEYDNPIAAAFSTPINRETQTFMMSTSLALRMKDHEVASYFCHFWSGHIFRPLVRAHPDIQYLYELSRSISPQDLRQQLVVSLCGEDTEKQKEAVAAGKKALNVNLALLDGIHQHIQDSQPRFL
jgi:hypothetical protein